MDCRNVWGSSAESVVLDHHRINGSILDADAFLWSASLGEDALSSVGNSAAVGRIAYLYGLSSVHHHECARSAGCIDERGA